MILRNSLILVVCSVMLFFVNSCIRKSPEQRVKDLFGISLPIKANIIEYRDKPSKEIVYKISITADDMNNLMLSLREYSSWTVVGEQQTFSAGTTVIKGNPSGTRRFACALISKGKLPVLIYDSNAEILYALIADGIM